MIIEQIDMIVRLDSINYRMKNYDSVLKWNVNEAICFSYDFVYFLTTPQRHTQKEKWLSRVSLPWT